PNPLSSAPTNQRQILFMSITWAPGYSVDLTDAATVASRYLRGLGRPVQIDFRLDSGNENDLVKWYRERSNPLVHAVQLRRERQGPYFHQFVVFELKDNGGLFRIDRRLRPDEDSPQNCLKDEGIPAFDTIEPVTAWNDPLFVASDCLISIEFKVNVSLAGILKVCQRIHSHLSARVYTLQRYNCYFFAQTIISCVACGTSDQYIVGDQSWFLGNGTKPPLPKRQRAVFNFYNNPTSLSTSGDQYMDLAGYPQLSASLSIATVGFTYDWSFLDDEIQRTFGLDPVHGMEGPLRRTAQEMQLALEEYWSKERTIVQKLIDTRNRMLIIPSGLWGVNEKTISPRIVDTITLEARVRWQAFLLSLRNGDHLRDYVFCSDPLPRPGEPLNRPRRRNAGLLLSPSELQSILVQRVDREYDKIWGIISTEYIQEAAEQALQIRLHSFKQNMTIRINRSEMQDGYQEKDHPEHSLGTIPRYTTPQGTTFWRRKKAKQEQEPNSLRESTMVEMQEYLTRLVQAHSIRVEEYRWLTRASAPDVARDVTKVMDEIWTTLIE
ncbi:unnamed protein product, partial [Rhizoctonia solani]